MGGKKALGENSKKAAGNARKAESAAKKAAEESARKAQLEDQEWSKGAKSNAKKYTHLSLLMLSPLSFKPKARAMFPTRPASPSTAISLIEE
jgi:membrane protein involved in colicin uptake